jgi:hypothetical protein
VAELLLLTVDSIATSNISFDTQGPPNTTIRLILRQGLFAVMDPDSLATKKPSGQDKVLLPTVLWSMWHCCL